MTQLDPQEQQQPDDSQPIPRALLIVFGLAALLLAGALLYYAYGRLTTGDETNELLESIPSFSGTTESGGVAPIQPDFSNVPQAGDPAPDFELATLSGETARLSDFRGRPVILNFWATWCAPCRLEMPELERARAEFGESGPAVLTINQGESAEQVNAFFDEVGLTLPALLDGEGDVGTVYGAFFLPMTVIVDPDGVVAAIHRGMISRDELNGYLSEIGPAEGS